MMLVDSMLFIQSSNFYIHEMKISQIFIAIFSIRFEGESV